MRRRSNLFTSPHLGLEGSFIEGDLKETVSMEDLGEMGYDLMSGIERRQKHLTKLKADRSRKKRKCKGKSKKTHR